MIKFQLAYLRARITRLVERFWYWLAWATPKTLVYFIGIRLWANATTGEYSHVEAPGVLMEEAIKRWDKCK